MHNQRKAKECGGHTVPTLNKQINCQWACPTYTILIHVHTQHIAVYRQPLEHANAHSVHSHCCPERIAEIACQHG